MEQLNTQRDHEANGADKRLVLHVQFGSDLLSITTLVSLLANDFDVLFEAYCTGI